MENELSLPTRIDIQIPENQFERLMYVQGLVERLQKLQTECASYIAAETERLIDVEDENYKLEPVFDSRKSTIILSDKLKEDNPELYENCLTISGSNALKLIGEDKLWGLCVKLAGRERTTLSSDITLKQMKKVMTDEEFKQYTVETRKQKGYTVVHK